MKTKVLSRFSHLLLAVLLMSFSDSYTIKRVSDLNFRYEFYTTEKKINPKTNKIYYWFKGGLIHNTQSGIAGDLLDDKFIKMYHSNQLAEQGEFKKGLKVGLWKSWHPNGTIETTQHWHNGLKTGGFYHYDENGAIVEKGYYSRNKKQGDWIDYIKKDTLIYKRGAVVVPKKQKASKLEKFKLKQQNNRIEQSKKELQESKELKDASLLDTYKATAKANKKVLKESKKALKENEKAAKKPVKGDSKIKKVFKNLFSQKVPKQ